MDKNTKTPSHLDSLMHVVKSQQFSREMLEELFLIADYMPIVEAMRGCKRLQDKIIAVFFYEESTRTRLSFQAAIKLLGGQILSTSNAKFSSVAKGENLVDTVRTLNNYCDAIIMRHKVEGSAEIAARICDEDSSAIHGYKHFINAGDGPGQHVTQALLDCYSIRKELGRIDGIKIAMVGDLLHGRTVRSLSYMLTKFKDVQIFFVSPDELKMKDDVIQYLTEQQVPFISCACLEDVISNVDVLYMTRIQQERFTDPDLYELMKDSYVLDSRLMKLFSPKGIVLHPLPRVDEIKEEVDIDPRAAYFRQEKNGLFIRMALLLAVFDKHRGLLSAIRNGKNNH
ncbi:MAG: aspartate carbamoyltransferase [Candidatus Komeilibacteria bacterium CG_4_10_14_0_2_um_filter_37_10]|uniref:Aspartate carbamoyltransferase n=1 Tax=Candidatus Komeilibacteria bacterium CG_4_10_14_0_2_um_filter_37_10 TaxID=1974470 RepID=A0A2M7VGJ0_9BACT|nr:MAG: aspartate carbamoyltransferase [Candidatus Komeilibacteria bacterium CG_4_10_14_0_2_um_filter_37_10]